jgi:hypothetical protein
VKGLKGLAHPPDFEPVAQCGAGTGIQHQLARLHGSRARQLQRAGRSERPVAPGLEGGAPAQAFLQQRPKVQVKGKRGGPFADGRRHFGTRVALRQHGMGIQVVVEAPVVLELEREDDGGKGVHVARDGEKPFELAVAAQGQPLVPDEPGLAQGDGADVS